LTRTLITPSDHTKAIGAYSPGVKVSLEGKSLLFISGQVASDENGKAIGLGDPALQTEYVFQKIKAVLKEAGGDLEDLASVVIYVKSIDDFPAISDVRNKYLATARPSSTLVEVSRMVLDEVLVEISGVAVVSR
jgi:2-iminobutanoate/2-iminopropanoate deaminase